MSSHVRDLQVDAEKVTIHSDPDVVLARVARRGWRPRKRRRRLPPPRAPRARLVLDCGRRDAGRR